MIKVVYFDELSATDYLNIYDGGEKVKTVEEIENQHNELTAKLGAKLSKKLSWLPLLGTDISVSGGMEYSDIGTSLIKNTLSNTVLTDFISKAKEDDRVYKLEEYDLKTYKNSIAFFKMFTPYLTITKSDFTTNDGMAMDISKLDEAFKNGKGYYEMIAERNTSEYKKRYILRFNIQAFRNNYGIADLTKMNLKYFAIKVGEANEEMLDINKEFSMDQQDTATSIDSLLNNNDTKEEKLEVFDVVLAGVEA